MAFHQEYPFGLDRITLHVKGQTKRIVINPNDPASVYDSITEIMGRDIIKATFTPTENPEYNEWREAVADRETLKSFDDWKAERN